MSFSRISYAAVSLLLVAQLVGCSFLGLGSNNAGEVKKLNKNDTFELKVMNISESSLSFYTELFQTKFPNAELIEVYPPDPDAENTDGTSPIEKWKKVIAEEQPDILILPYDIPGLYKQLAEEGQLYGLDNMIQDEKFDVQNIHPSIIEDIKSKSDGKLYGLSPSYTNKVLFYNKSLFLQHGVPFPTNQMSWEQLSELAMQFPTTGTNENRLYAFASASTWGDTSLGSFFVDIGNSMGITFFDKDFSTVAIQTDKWKKSLEILTKLAMSGLLPYDYLQQSDLFPNGRAAMVIKDISYSDQIQSVANPVDWDIVTVPVDPKNPTVMVNDFNFRDIIAIRSDSPNLSASWEFVKYFNGSEFADILASDSRLLSSRSAYLQQKYGRSLEPLTKLKLNEDLFKDKWKLPENHQYFTFTHIVEEELLALMDEKQSIDETLKKMQDRAHAQFVIAKQEQENSYK